jgi:RNA recognition motif-containing protein
VLFVKNLPFKITTEELYDLFGKYGAIQQIRMYAELVSLLSAFCFGTYADADLFFSDISSALCYLFRSS